MTKQAVRRCEEDLQTDDFEDVKLTKEQNRTDKPSNRDHLNTCDTSSSVL